MIERNESAKDLQKHYQKLAQGLINTYCQVRSSHPLDSFPKLASAIKRCVHLTEIWATIAHANVRGKK